MTPPRLFTFDIFGTVLDWQKGTRQAILQTGRQFDSVRDFDRIMDRQGELEQQGYRSYRSIVKDSLTQTIGIDPNQADAIGATVGTWPLFPDSTPGLSALMRIAPCAAITNSDAVHGEQVQKQLGFRLSHWISAEESRVYKPNPDFWKFAAQKMGAEFGPHWWHVSAYADYDLEAARELGLTCVFISRPHSRRWRHDIEATDLVSLAAQIPKKFTVQF